MARKIVMALVALGIVAALVYDSFSSCVLDPEQAADLVSEELTRLGLDRKHLSGAHFDAAHCEYSADYNDGRRHLDYVVIDDALHGPRLTQWDHARDRDRE